MAKFFSKVKSIFNVVAKALKIASDWLMDKILKKCNFIIFMVIISIVAIILRIKFIDFQSSDFTNFLKPWCERLAGVGGFSNFKQGVANSDYTMPYLYILTVISYFKPEHYLYGIKAVSIFFDFVLAIFVALTVKKITKSNTGFIVSYSLILFLPNVLLNSAIWGQCDVMYTCFIVMCIYFMLFGKNRLAMVCYGISFALKIQAIFFIPVILLVMAKKKVNFFYFLYSFLAIFVLNIPALCLGTGFTRAFITPFKTQTNTYKESLSLNAVNLYFLIDKCAHYGLYEGEPNVLWKKWASPAFVFFAIGIIVFAFVIVYRKNYKLSAKRLVLVSYFFAMLVPYVLPHMHERYWYLSDILAILFMFCYRKQFYIGLLSCYPSFRICLNFLFDTGLNTNGTTDLISKIVLVLMMLLAIILTFNLIIKEFKDDDEVEIGENIKSGAISSLKPINSDYTVTDLSTNQVVKSLAMGIATVEEQTFEDFMAEETEEEKAFGDSLEKSIWDKFFKVEDLPEDEGECEIKALEDTQE